MSNPNKVLESRIQEFHAQGLTAKEIAAQVGGGYANVRRIATKYGLKFQGSGGQNRVVQWNPFKERTPEADYWIGFLAADGWLSSVKCDVCFGIVEEYHITRYRDWVDPKLKVYKSASRSTYTVQFGHPEAYNTLREYGFTPAKSHTLELTIPLTRHLVRGIFDGDGHAPKKNNSAKITSSSILFLRQIQDFLAEEGVDTTLGVQEITGSGTAYYLHILARTAQKFYDLMYRDTTLFLERKEERMRKWTATRKSTLKLKELHTLTPYLT